MNHLINNKKIALFIPTYNVESSISSVLDSIPNTVLAKLYKVYIIDNGSTDGTIKKIKNYIEKSSSNQIELYQNIENVMLGGSTISAFQKAIKDEVDFIVCMHSDGQARSSDLSFFINAFESGNYDFVLGNRFSPLSQVENYSPLRLFFNKFFSYLQRLIIRQSVYDIGAFIGFKVSTIQSFDFQKIPSDMGYHPYLILSICRFSSRKINFCEFPIFWGEVSSTNINMYKYGLKHLFRILFLFFGLVFYSKAPVSPVRDRKL